MTTATVTYHELPPLTSWASDGQNNHQTPPTSHPTSLANPILPSQQFICNQPITHYRPELEIRESYWLNSNFLQPNHFQQIHSNSAPVNSNDYRTKKRGNSNSFRLHQAPSSSIVAAQTISEELCLVCGDKASGYHYNALTCEGCKGFFRRSITRKAVYYCKYGESCDIDMYMRRKCQHCRLRKCMDIGMRPERLRADSRVPLVVIPEDQCRIKREAKQKLRTAVEQRKSDSPQAVTSTESLNCNLTVETRELINRVITLENQYSMPSNDSVMRFMQYENGSGTFTELAELTILHLQLIHEYTNNLPGFSKINETDQRTLHMACKSEVMTLRTARFYDCSEDCLIFGSDLKQWRFTLQEYSEFVGNLGEPIFDFAQSLSKMQLDQAEFGLLTAIAIFSDRAGLICPKDVEDIQEVYTSALQSYLELRRPKQRTMFARLLMKLTDLRTFAPDQTEIFPKLYSITGRLPTVTSEIKQMPTKSVEYPSYSTAQFLSEQYQSSSPPAYHYHHSNLPE